jgi:dipeptidyl aminopeptidase/acylaminoacyl peptidase
MSSLTSAYFSRPFLTPFYSPPVRFAGTSAGTFYQLITDGRGAGYRLNPAAGTNKLTRLTGAGTFKGQWIYGNTGVAYVGTKGNENYLAVEAEDKSLNTNLFVGGNVLSYSVSPQRDKIYAVASLGHEPLGIWEYDIAGKHLRNVLPGEEHSFTVSHFIAPVQMSVTKNGENIPYFMLPPPRFDVHRKYPVLIDQPVNDRCEPGPQFLADAGIFYVSVTRRAQRQRMQRAKRGCGHCAFGGSFEELTACGGIGI